MIFNLYAVVFSVPLGLFYVLVFFQLWAIRSLVRRMSTLDATRAELALLVLYLNKAEARDKICRAIQYGSKFLSNGQPGTAQNVDKSTSLARKVFRLFKVLFKFSCLLHDATISMLSLIFQIKSFSLDFVVCQWLARSHRSTFQRDSSSSHFTRKGNTMFAVKLKIGFNNCHVLSILYMWSLQSKNALLSTFLFLDQIVWLGRTGVYKVYISSFLIISNKEVVWNCFEKKLNAWIGLYRTKNVQSWLAGSLSFVGWAPPLALLWLRFV